MTIKGPDWLLVAAVVALIFGSGVIFGGCQSELATTRYMRREAIEHNAAEYVCDPKTGETVFRWKENK